VGIFLTRLVVVLVLVRVVIYIRRPPVMQEAWSLSRAEIVQQLERKPSDHLVLVRYTPQHNVHDEWVYNSADIDHAKIVWAREIPGVNSKPLIDYFRNRRVWVVEADTLPVQLTPYEPSASTQALNPPP
jgi:hypothetical protein